MNKKKKDDFLIDDSDLFDKMEKIGKENKKNIDKIINKINRQENND